MNLSIIVPTKNRLYYIKKLIRYYSLINFQGKLIILDSSEKNISEEILKEVSINTSLKIEYFHSIGLPCAMMKKYINNIQTKYVVFSGDDDYFIKEGIQSCIDFLDNNFDFSGCTGEGISIHSSTKNNKIDYITKYEQAKIYAISSVARIKQLYKHYKVPIFSIFRKEVLAKFLEVVPSSDVFRDLCPDKAIADEYIIEGAMVAYGNIQYLNDPYLVRHIHKERNIDNLVPDFKKDWIKTPNFEKSITFFFVKISKIISEIDNIEENEALKILKQNFDYHLQYELKREKQYMKKIFFSKTILRINFIKNFRYFLKKNFFTKQKYFKLKSNNKYKLIIKSIEGN